MRLTWTEPWNRALVRWNVRRVSREMPSARWISIGGGVLSLAAMVGVRLTLPESAEVLTWGRVAGIVLMCAMYAWWPYFIALFPSSVHISEKGAFFQCGGSGGLIPCGRIRSISFEDRDGLHLFVVRWESKRGKVCERMAVSSRRIPDCDVVRFLADVGLAHLYVSYGQICPV